MRNAMRPFGQRPSGGLAEVLSLLMGVLNSESHRTLGSEKSADGVEDFPDLTVVLLIPFFQFFEAPGQVLMRRQEFAQFDKSAHDRNVHLNCPSLLSTLESIATPCSVNTNGR